MKRKKQIWPKNILLKRKKKLSIWNEILGQGCPSSRGTVGINQQDIVKQPWLGTERVRTPPRSNQCTLAEMCVDSNRGENDPQVGLVSRPDSKVGNWEFFRDKNNVGSGIPRWLVGNPTLIAKNSLFNCFKIKI